MTKKYYILTFILLAVVVSALTAISVWSATYLPGKSPKIANIFFRWDITEAEAKQLARWDILLIDMEVQHYSPNSLKLIRQYNPNIKLLAYLASQEIRGDSGNLPGTLRKKFYDQIPTQWWLRDKDGNQVQWWPGNPILNVTYQCPTVDGKKYFDMIAWFVKNEILSTGLWDGIFYDNVWEGIDFLESFNIDLNGDGMAESKQTLTAEWKKGMTTLLSNSRSVFGPNVLIVGNGGDGYYNYINGALYETFPDNGWEWYLNKYRFISKNGYSPAIGIINTNVKNTGRKNDFQKMRYGLASAMLGDGFYSFDNGDQSHTEIWWYDEYEVSLGRPLAEPINILNNSSIIQDGVWRRDYERGVVLVNSTSKNYTVDLKGEYEKLHGQQDKVVNSGAIVSKIELPAKDGLILLKTVEEITNASFINGNFARIFDSWGRVKRGGFFSYVPMFPGSTEVMLIDINKDNNLEYLVADASSVGIYDYNARLISKFYPYEAHYNQGINFAVGDLDGNGTLEIITGTKNGGGPHIRIFNSAGKLINPGFFAYAKNFRGGVDVAVGDLDGNGTMEIIAGAGVGGGPHIRVFNKDGKLINPGFFAYAENFRGGVNVAVGDFDSDGRDEIVSGAGFGGSPQIKIFDQDGQLKLGQFYAFNQTSRAGVDVTVGDIDQDGVLEIITTSNDVFAISN